MEYPMRLNKYLAHNGLASRREADALIEAGKVLVNGAPAELGQKVSETDKVELKGKTKDRIYLTYYKARGIITHSPGPDEVDIATKLKEVYTGAAVSPVGRLDKDSEGLILLSNDGRITGPLLDPEAGHEKEYDVTVDKPLNHWFLKHMGMGVDIEGYTTKPAVVKQNPRNPKRFTLIITEGKKHQIRRMCAALGYQVQALRRVRVMHITLGELKPNQYRKLTPEERATLLKEFGLT